MATPSASQRRDFQSTCLYTKGRWPTLASTSQKRITGATSAGAKNSVSRTIMIMEKPKPVAPRTMPARKTAAKT